MKYQLIKPDYIDIKHPKTGRIHRLYRIIALKTFGDDSNPVTEQEIGGYIQSEKNLSHEGSCWVANTAKVFGDAVVSDNARIIDDGAVYDSAKVCGNSVISHYARIFERATVIDSFIGDTADVHGDSVVTRCDMNNSSKVYQQSTATDTVFSDGAMLHGKAVVTNCKLSDVSEVRGDANLINCVLSGRAIVDTGEHINETLTADVELNITIGK